MAFQLNDTTYSGEYSEYMITRAMYSMDTVEKNLVYVKDDIKKLYTIKRLDYSKPLKPRQAVPVPSANSTPFTIDGKQLIPKDVDIYEEFNPRDLESTELAERLQDVIIDREVPQTLESQMIQITLNRAGEQFENGIWMGSEQYFGNVTATDDRYQIQYFNGYMQRWVNDPLINLSTISPVAITDSNILTIMNDLISVATVNNKALITDKNTFNWMKFMFSAKTCGHYQNALIATDFKGMDFTSGQIPLYRGYKVERVAGMPNDTVVFCRGEDSTDSNLWIGVNSTKDWELKIGKTGPANETYFIQGKFKWDVNYGWSEEIFLYTRLSQASFIA